MKKVIGISILLAGLAAMLIYFGWLQNDKNPNVSIMRTVATNTTKSPGSADWASSAMTIDELMSESDLVVRVRVISAPVYSRSSYLSVGSARK